MSVEVKICGLSTKTDIDAAIDDGGDYVGLVFFEPSPRNLALSDAAGLADHARGRAKIVALTVDADDSLIAAIDAAVTPDIYQLHGSETPDRVRHIGEATKKETMKVIKVATAADAEAAFAYGAFSDRILFDAKAPPGSLLPGGNGLQFDWTALNSVNGRLDYMLSGGLTPETVVEAVRLTGAKAVDVSSGVEFSPGKKDPARIRAFLRAAKGL
ncbi:MAG: phosphoribosylanthranilate isomerase [Hyphomicrobiaceae bacterium]